MRNALVVIFVFSLLVIYSCERDDICAEATPTTPQLILRFYDVAEQETTKSVNALWAFGLDDDDNSIQFQDLAVSTTDSIVIPLRTDADQTRFVLIRDLEVNDNDTPDDTSDDFITGNEDVITVNYIRDDVFVSRACGFKTVFNQLLFGVSVDTDNWVINSSVVEADVVNENQAHVQVFH
ncbi:MAG: DUF6452 family protein [bacterium]